MIRLSEMSKRLLSVFFGVSLSDILLPVWIILAIVCGVLLSVYVPSSRDAFKGTEVVGVPVPLAVGLIVMMLPPLCKVEWEKFFKILSDRSTFYAMVISLTLNWIVCPLVMFGLAWTTMFDQEEYRTGVIMIGLARCVAMVLTWNEIAGGDNNLCAILVLMNSTLQLVLYAPYQLLFCNIITGSGSDKSINLAYSTTVKSVAFFLGVPLLAGFIIRLTLVRLTGITIYEKNILPFISPWAILGLLYTVLVIFIERGYDFVNNIDDAVRCFIPILAYFIITWFGTFFSMRWLGDYTNTRKLRSATMMNDESELSRLLCGCEEQKVAHPNRWTKGCSANYKTTVTQTLSAVSNNFELSLAIAISLYGSGSKQAIAATFGPLLEIPILLILSYVAKYLKRNFLWNDIDLEEDF